MAGRIKHTLPSWFLAALSLVVSTVIYSLYATSQPQISSRVPLNAHHILERCRTIRSIPGPPPDFHSRHQSDRFVPGTKPTLLQNGTIWTGLGNSKSIMKGDVLLDGGIIKDVGTIDLRRWGLADGQVDVLDLRGAWVSPGIIDLHSHIGVEASPLLTGATDGNSLHGITQPWLRSLDAINTHDASYELSTAGGVTTSLILPGSANAIGGQAFVIKLRPTAERSPSSKLVEQLDGVNSTGWRQLKQACGENPSRIYSGTRMDTAWAFRTIYDEARKLKNRQDVFCASAEAGLWSDLDEFPDDLKYEALVDVLRGKAKVQTHCYEAVDFDALVRLSREFEFPIAAFHHAHEAYLVPDLLKKAWGPTPPAVAMFAIMGRYKKEAYRGSEFASRILNDHGLKVVLKSDHPAINSRFLLHEAQQAHYYGLPANVALAAVTSTPAGVMGLDHRIGYVKRGYDADVVIWDSHPLALGATPIQVYADGIPQLPPLATLPLKPTSSQLPPITPDFNAEAQAAIAWEGLPPLSPSHVSTRAVFVNVSSLWRRDSGGHWVEKHLSPDRPSLHVDRPETRDMGTVVVEDGRIVCAGTHTSCSRTDLSENDVIRLDGGTLAPGLVSVGSGLGLRDIWLEPVTNDGIISDPLYEATGLPRIAGGDELIVRAVDGLLLGTRDALLALRSGVTSAIAAPDHAGILAGLSMSFSLGASHKLERGAVLKELVALHISLRYGGGDGGPSTSTKIALLRRLLLEGGKGELGLWFQHAAQGEIPLIVDVTSADIISTLILLKSTVEKHTGKKMHLTLLGATEAHLLAHEIGEAGIGVIIAPSRPFPNVWEERRIIPGRPLSNKSAIEVLLQHNVTVGLGPNPQWQWAARNARFDAAWVALDSHGKISRQEALALVTTNLEQLMGLDATDQSDMVAYKGGDWDEMESKVVAIVRHTGTVEQF